MNATISPPLQASDASGNLMEFSVVSAVNNEEILQSCLLKSPEAGTFGELILQRGFASASTAYNNAIERAKHDVVVLMHQDIYLPAGWLAQVTAGIEHLQAAGQEWAVLGIFGMNSQLEFRGHLYCVASTYILGAPLAEPAEVVSLDEIILIVRKSSGVRFDELLPGFHFYGTDISLSAQRQGFKVHVVPGFCIHNSNEYGIFPSDFWESYRFMQHKWKQRLPVRTPCITIHRSWAHPLLHTAKRFLQLRKMRRPLTRRISDPADLYTRLLGVLPDLSMTDEMVPKVAALCR